jgi:hypothetical protein
MGISFKRHSVVEFLFESAMRIANGHPKLMSLYAIIVLQMLDQQRVQEKMLRWLIPHLLRAIKAKMFPEAQTYYDCF